MTLAGDDSRRHVPDGVLIIDKPQGPTSHDVVAIARRALGESRIGHTGTLDPLATGVLPLVVGRATRLAQYFTASRKEYEATMMFGRVTDSYDVTGTVVNESPDRPTRDQLDAVIAGFRGAIEQTPPAFSAKSIDGHRAYALARKGGDGPPRRPKAVTVTVEHLEVLDFDGDTARLGMRVSAGFYVRSLVHDVGGRLGMGATLTALRRTRAGEFDLSRAVSMEDLLRQDRAILATRLVPLDTLLAHLPSVELGPQALEHVKNGREVGPNDMVGVSQPVAELTRLMGPGGRFLALAKPGKTPGFLHASVVFGLT